MDTDGDLIPDVPLDNLACSESEGSGPPLYCVQVSDANSLYCSSPSKYACPTMRWVWQDAFTPMLSYSLRLGVIVGAAWKYRVYAA